VRSSARVSAARATRPSAARRISTHADEVAHLIAEHARAAEARGKIAEISRKNQDVLDDIGNEAAHRERTWTAEPSAQS
jgi:hypothetical protein